MNSEYKHRLKRAANSNNTDTDDNDSNSNSINGGTRPATPTSFNSEQSSLSSPRKRKRGPAPVDRFIPAHSETPPVVFNSGPSTPSRATRRTITTDIDPQTEQANEAFTQALSAELFPTSSLLPALTPATSRTPSRASSSSSANHNSSTTVITTSSPHHHQVHHTASSPHRPPQTPSRTRVLSFASPTRPSRTSGTANIFGTDGLKLSASRGLASPRHEIYNTSPIRDDTRRVLMSPKRSTRPVPKTPFKVLDAPDLMDDFYLNLVDWSSTNVLAVGLAGCVYLWAANTAKVVKLCDLRDDHVTGIGWERQGSTLAVGTQKGLIHIYDADTSQLVRTYNCHTQRVGALSWSMTPTTPGAAASVGSYSTSTLSSGSRDHTIVHRDLRAPEDSYRRLTGHRQEICGLKWNFEGTHLASGGNDNKLLVWDASWSSGAGRGAGKSTEPDTADAGVGDVNPQPLYKFHEHQAAVKAIAWSPHTTGLLASGGGTQDKTIRTWNIANGQLVNWLDTGSQVCNLTWSKTTNEIVSTHGYSSTKAQHQVCIWKYPSMDTTATLSGHTHRVLYLAMSPDGETIVTGAGDETLRFWHAFPKLKSQPKKDGIVDYLGREQVIR